MPETPCPCDCPGDLDLDLTGIVTSMTCNESEIHGQTGGTCAIFNLDTKISDEKDLIDDCYALKCTDETAWVSGMQWGPVWLPAPPTNLQSTIRSHWGRVGVIDSEAIFTFGQGNADGYNYNVGYDIGACIIYKTLGEGNSLFTEYGVDSVNGQAREGDIAGNFNGIVVLQREGRTFDFVNPITQTAQQLFSQPNNADIVYGFASIANGFNNTDLKNLFVDSLITGSFTLEQTITIPSNGSVNFTINNSGVPGTGYLRDPMPVLPHPNKFIYLAIIAPGAVCQGPVWSVNNLRKCRSDLTSVFTQWAEFTNDVYSGYLEGPMEYLDSGGDVLDSVSFF